jgi:hypothetical protein
MYTNIDTDHAVLNLEDVLPVHLIPFLLLIMKKNIFQFSNTFWIQKDGTAMGVPCACAWATLYFAGFEEDMLEKYSRYLILFRRYIDDGLGIWLWDESPECRTAWMNYKADMQTYGKLRWTFVEPCKTIDFLDLTLTLQRGRISCSLFEKKLNLYLYLPPHSAHPPGVLKGLVTGMIIRIMRLVSDPSERRSDVQNLFYRLVARGHSHSMLKLAFSKAIAHSTQQMRPGPASLEQLETERSVFLHVPFHPHDPPSSELQKAWRMFMWKNILSPYQPELPSVKNKKGKPIGINRLIVAYHRPPNLGNLLTPRRFDKVKGPKASHWHSRAGMFREEKPNTSDNDSD